MGKYNANTDEEIERRFQALLGTLEQTSSDIRYVLDLLDADIAHYKKEGARTCSSHTHVAWHEELGTLLHMCEGIYHGYYLIRTYHILLVHDDSLDLLKTMHYLAQQQALEQAVEAFKEGLEKWRKAQGDNNSPPDKPSALPKEQTRSEMSSSNWMDKLFKR